jgi:hypothetical protein
MDCFAEPVIGRRFAPTRWLAMTCFCILAAPFRASFARKHRVLNPEGAGNAGRSMRPQPRVRNKKAHEQVTTVTPVSPDIPRAMVYGLFRALPGDRALLPPSSAKLLPPT